MKLVAEVMPTMINPASYLSTTEAQGPGPAWPVSGPTPTQGFWM